MRRIWRNSPTLAECTYIHTYLCINHFPTYANIFFKKNVEENSSVFGTNYSRNNLLPEKMEAYMRKPSETEWTNLFTCTLRCVKKGGTRKEFLHPFLTPLTLNVILLFLTLSIRL